MLERNMFKCDQDCAKCPEKCGAENPGPSKLEISLIFDIMELDVEMTTTELRTKGSQHDKNTVFKLSFSQLSTTLHEKIAKMEELSQLCPRNNGACPVSEILKKMEDDLIKSLEYFVKQTVWSVA